MPWLPRFTRIQHWDLIWLDTKWIQMATVKPRKKGITWLGLSIGQVLFAPHQCPTQPTQSKELQEQLASGIRPQPAPVLVDSQAFCNSYINDINVYYKTTPKHRNQKPVLQFFFAPTEKWTCIVRWHSSNIKYIFPCFQTNAFFLIIFSCLSQGSLSHSFPTSRRIPRSHPDCLRQLIKGSPQDLIPSWTTAGIGPSQRPSDFTCVREQAELPQVSPKTTWPARWNVIYIILLECLDVTQHVTV